MIQWNCQNTQQYWNAQVKVPKDTKFLFSDSGYNDSGAIQTKVHTHWHEHVYWLSPRDLAEAQRGVEE